MNMASIVRKALRGQRAEWHREAVERAIDHEKELVRQHPQAMTSGSRVMSNMAGMMQLMSMAGQDNDEDR